MPDQIKPLKKITATTKKAKKQKAKEALSKRTKEMGGPNMSYSPAEMGHDSPAQNHHYGMRKGESIKQEKYNLMHDDPVPKDASGGRDMSWMSKHSNSALNMNYDDSPAKNLGHGMDDMSPEKGAHRKYHLKQRMSKKSKDSVAEMKYDSATEMHCKG